MVMAALWVKRQKRARRTLGADFFETRRERTEGCLKVKGRGRRSFVNMRACFRQREAFGSA